MRLIKKLPSIVLWLYVAAIVIPEHEVDERLPSPAAAMVNGTFGLLERGAAEGFEALRNQIEQPPPSADG